MKKKLIYVCSPMKGDVQENVKRAREYAKAVLYEGHIPVVPHLMLAGVLDDESMADRSVALEIGLELVFACEEVWVFGERISEGMQGEIEEAKKNGITVLYVIQDKGKMIIGEKAG